MQDDFCAVGDTGWVLVCRKARSRDIHVILARSDGNHKDPALICSVVALHRDPIRRHWQCGRPRPFLAL